MIRRTALRHRFLMLITIIAVGVMLIPQTGQAFPIAVIHPCDWGDEASDTPIPLQSPFGAGTSVIVGGLGNYYGDGDHTDYYNDYYATDWSATSTGQSTKDMAVYPVADGYIIKIGWTAIGYTVTIQHAQQVETSYGHMVDNSAVGLSEGQYVTTSDQIGRVGNTVGAGGYTTGAHLHLRFRVNGESLRGKTAKPSPMDGQKLCDGQPIVASQKHSARTRYDYNGDGDADILWRHVYGDIYLWMMNGIQVNGSGPVALVDPAWKILGSGDYNGDGKADILWRHDYGNVYLWTMDGTNISGGGPVAVIDPAWKILSSGDYNGDGKADILWRHDYGNVYLWTMDGTNISGGGPVAVIDPAWKIRGDGDYNGDGKADILWRHDYGNVYLWTMDGTNISGGGPVAVIDPAWKIRGGGDYNGDGKADILWRHDYGNVYLWTMDGTNISGGGPIAYVDPTWKIVGSGDYNGGGNADILWRHDYGNVYLTTMDDNSGGPIAIIDPAWKIINTGPDSPAASSSDMKENASVSAAPPPQILTTDLLAQTTGDFSLLEPQPHASDPAFAPRPQPNQLAENMLRLGSSLLGMPQPGGQVPDLIIRAPQHVLPLP